MTHAVGRRVGVPVAALAAAGTLAVAGATLRASPAAPAPQRHVVEMQGMGFHPAVLETSRGDTVVWINRDIVPHTATAAGKGGWTTGLLSPGDSGRHVTREAGSDTYVCELHPTMRGRLVVR